MEMYMWTTLESEKKEDKYLSKYLFRHVGKNLIILIEAVNFWIVDMELMKKNLTKVDIR